MRQGWVVKFLNLKTKKVSYKTVLGNLSDAEAQRDEWVRRLEEKGVASKFSVQVTFPYAEYERDDFSEIRCVTDGEGHFEAVAEVCSNFDAFVEEDPDIAYSYIIETYKDDILSLMDALQGAVFVNSVRPIPRLEKFIEETIRIKEEMDRAQTISSKPTRMIFFR